MSRHDREHWEGKHREAAERSGPPASFLRQNAALLRPGRTLDLACGRGRNARFLADVGHRVFAVDVARSALEAVRAAAPAVNVIRMDLDTAAFRPSSLDNVICIDFLDRRLLEVIPEWLRPGGILVYETFLIDQRTIGHPRNPDFLLRHGELLDRLRGRLRTLRYREGLFEEDAGSAFRAGCVAVRGD